jgi:hypothetical protein
MALSVSRHGPAGPGHLEPQNVGSDGPDQPGHDVKGESQSLSALV